jgi:nicotinate-nucleotide pyrophosphorylase (carboxylating)
LSTLDQGIVRDRVRLALAEDLGALGDLTTRLSVPVRRRAAARIISKGSGILAGIDVARECFQQVDPGVGCEVRHADGDRLAPGDVVLELHGAAASLLAAERTALNFLQRMSGIATLTSQFVESVRGTGAAILDTRKTAPGLRAFDKHAVAVGGGMPHRGGLFDQVLLKENHFALAAPDAYEVVVRRCVAGSRRPVVAEARTRQEAVAAVRGGAAVVLLDNFAPDQELVAAVQAVREAARAAGRSVQTEASGGVTLANVRHYAECGVDRISIGMLTHSARALDLSLLVEVAG